VTARRVAPQRGSRDRSGRAPEGTDSRRFEQGPWAFGGVDSCATEVLAAVRSVTTIPGPSGRPGRGLGPREATRPRTLGDRRNPRTGALANPRDHSGLHAHRRALRGNAARFLRLRTYLATPPDRPPPIRKAAVARFSGAWSQSPVLRCPPAPQVQCPRFRLSQLLEHTHTKWLESLGITCLAAHRPCGMPTASTFRSLRAKQALPVITLESENTMDISTFDTDLLDLRPFSQRLQKVTSQ
jgi:hypothetical protein